MPSDESQQLQLPADPKHASEDFQRFFDLVAEFNSETDRAAVILGAAKVDQLLGELLQSVMLPCTTTKDELFDSDGPLASFSARISLCARLGLLDADFVRGLQILRRIRNSFAHEVSGCNLSNGAHADRVRELVKPLRSLPIYEVVRDVAAADHAGFSAEFRTVVAVLIGRLNASIAETRRLNITPISMADGF